MAVLGLILLSVLYEYDYSLTLGDYGPNSYALVVLFGMIAGGLSVLQWFFLPKQLADWWIAGNAAAAVVFGLMHRYLYYHSDGVWQHTQLPIFLMFWIIGNFAMGPILMRRTPKATTTIANIVSAEKHAFTPPILVPMDCHCNCGVYRSVPIAEVLIRV